MATASIAFEARSLLRAARVGTLALGGDGPDLPHAALVTPATRPDGGVIMLLSGLSAHTRLLRHDGRCALLVSGEPTDANPQTTPRLTLRGRAAPLDGEAAAAARAHYLRIHPYAGPYAGLGDFAPWRLDTVDALFVGGFGRARTMMASDLFPVTVAAIDADALAPMLAHTGGTVAGIDADGVDVRTANGGTKRVSFDAPAPDGKALAQALEQLAATGALA